MFLEVLMNNYKSLKKQLKFCIKTMNDSSSLFVVDSNKDFTRKRKHLFGSTLFNVLLLESGSLKDEMFKLFGYKLDTPTASSFVQARSKIRPDAFRTLFNMFNERTQKIKLHGSLTLAHSQYSQMSFMYGFFFVKFLFFTVVCVVIVI